MTEFKLSIITINFNNAEGLQKTLNSVAAQTYTGYEHIIIDGGSTDGSVEYIMQYKFQYRGVPDRLYWVSEADKGIYNAMNKGIEVAKGEYLFFLNSGDLLFKPETLNLVFSLNTLPDLIIGNLMLGEKKIEYPKKISFEQLAFDTICHQAILFKKILFQKYGNYDETFKLASDYKHLLELLLIHKASYIVVDEYICHFDNTGISSNPSSQEMVQYERNKAKTDVLAPCVWQFAEDFLIQKNTLQGLKSSGIIKLAFKLISILNRFR